MRSPVSALQHELDIAGARRRGPDEVRQTGQIRLHIGGAHAKEGLVTWRSVSPDRSKVARLDGRRSRRQVRPARTARQPRGSAEEAFQEAHRPPTVLSPKTSRLIQTRFAIPVSVAG